MNLPSHSFSKCYTFSSRWRSPLPMLVAICKRPWYTKTVSETCAIDPDSRGYRLVSTVTKIESKKVKAIVWEVLYITGWWFQLLFMFIPVWGNHPIWWAYVSIGLVQPPTFWEVPYQGSLNCPFWGESNNTKCVVILKDFPYHNALLGLVIQWPLHILVSGRMQITIMSQDFSK